MSLEQALPASDLFTPTGVSGNALSARDLATTGVLAGVTRPSGEITMYGATVAPDGWLLCNGAAVSRSVYASLFSIIGTAYGVGDGSSTFNVPDIQGRMPIGLGTHTDVAALGNNDALTVANRRAKHRHTHSLAISGGSHSHNFGVSVFADGSTATGPNAANSAQIVTSTQSATHSHPNGEFSGTIGNSTNDNIDAPPYVVVNFIIKV